MSHLVLLIEDDVQPRRVLKTSLRHRGWTTVEADCGKAGLAMLNSEHPDLVILDLG